MRSTVFIVYIIFLMFSLNAYSQTTANVATGGTGWKRLAFVSGNAGRGFGKVTLYTTGGSFTPVMATIDWFHDWSSVGGITLHSESKSSPHWSAARITNDGTSTYIEVNFITDVTTLSLISDNYGYRPATLYTGTLPNGGGNVRATANAAKFNIENSFAVNYNGNVGVGTASPQAKLAVNGNILAKEIKIKTDISVPDYVFEPDYKMLSLSEVESYVKTHKHLPEIPSAKKIDKEGLDLAAMNLLLLKKVEELTLHQIALLKELKALKNELNNHLNEAHTK